MSVFTIKSNIRKVIRQLDKKFEFLADNLSDALVDTAIEWETRMKRKQFAPFKRTSYAKKLRQRTGRLRSSIRFRRKGKGLRTRVLLISEGVPYANIQEFGGKSKGRPWLRIPLSSTLGGTGQVRGDLLVNRSTWKTSRGERSFFFKSKKGNLLIGINRGGELLPLAVLKKSVTIPEGRFGFRRTWKGLIPFRRKAFRRAITAAKRGTRS